jgi:hypothetical protein
MSDSRAGRNQLELDHTIEPKADQRSLNGLKRVTVVDEFECITTLQMLLPDDDLNYLANFGCLAISS